MSILVDKAKNGLKFKTKYAFHVPVKMDDDQMKTSMFGLLSHVEVNVMKKILERRKKNHKIMPVLK